MKDMKKKEVKKEKKMVHKDAKQDMAMIKSKVKGKCLK